MRQRITWLDVDGHVLLAVPSVHYRIPFALEVNRICRSEDERPDAIAVELGSTIVHALREWAGEIYKASDETKRPWPVMLGLARQNRRIRASRKEAVMKLQAETGKELSDIDPEVLHRKLNYYGEHVVYLSPTDSIVEAVRCSCELGLPLYGIDLDEMADDIRPGSVLPDPWHHPRAVSHYVEENEERASQAYDPETDARREFAMAARLKALLAQYRRVLFVCGMGHWKRIKALLGDRSVKAAVLPEPGNVSGDNIRRFIVHPALAIKAIDLWPAMIPLYEKLRAADVLRRGTPTVTNSQVEKLFERQLRRAFREYCRSNDSKEAEPNIAQALAMKSTFERFLGNLTLLHARRHPDLALVLTAARAVMPDRFVETVTDVFMDQPWVSREEFPYPLLSPSSPGNSALCLVDGGSGGLGPKRVYVRSQLPSDQGNGPGRWWRQLERRLRLEFNFAGSRHTWLPWDYLTSGLSIQALRQVCRRGRARQSEVFAGGYFERVDSRSTIRAMVRGEDDLWVFSPTGRGQGDLELEDMDPVVWILVDEADSRSSWTLFSVYMDDMAKYAINREQFELRRRRLGSSLGCLVAYGTEAGEGKLRVRHDQIACQKLDGFAIYHPICWKIQQFTRWAAATGYRKNPFCPTTGALYDSLQSDLRELANIYCKDQWRESLILLALPFARRRVVVVAPAGFAPSSGLVRAADKRGVRLHCIPASRFSAEHLERLKWNYLTPLQQLEPEFVYPAWVEEMLGEPQSRYRELVPDRWLNFGEGQ